MVSMQTSSPQLELTLFTTRNMVFSIGEYLAGRQVFLASITSHVAVPYINPHAGMVSNKQDYIQVGQTTKSVDEVKNQIDSIYNTLISAENLPEMEPGNQISFVTYRESILKQGAENCV
jgi:hypothetical protein